MIYLKYSKNGQKKRRKKKRKGIFIPVMLQNSFARLIASLRSFKREQNRL